MNKIKKETLEYITIFILLIGILGVLSGIKLFNFYVNDEVDYNEWTSNLGSKYETDMATTFFGKFDFINLNGAIRNTLGQREMNGVVKLNNGYLLSPISRVEDETLQYYAQRVYELDSYLKTKDIPMVFALTPYTSSKYDPQLPVGVYDYGNDNSDRLIQFLNDAGVDTIDFRETMYEDGINQYDMMYKTDHHWNTAAGLYAYGKLENYIVSKTGCEVDYRVSDPSQYSITTYEKWHLGSRGQRVGKCFGGIDDFDLYIPKFETHLLNNQGEEGNFQDLIINMEPLENREIMSRYTYDWVLNNSLDHFTNLDCKNDKRILIVTDSYGKAVNPFLIMGFRDVYYIYDLGSNSINQELIEWYNPDVVILLYYPINAFSEEAYQFQVP